MIMLFVRVKKHLLGHVIHFYKIQYNWKIYGDKEQDIKLNKNDMVKI